MSDLHRLGLGILKEDLTCDMTFECSADPVLFLTLA